MKTQTAYEELRDAESIVSKCLQEIAYCNGVRAGWNAALLTTDADAQAKRDSLLSDPCKRLSTLKEARREITKLLEDK